jgi:hydrogenase expression/formation protein HypE
MNGPVDEGRVLLTHGSGGRLTRDLIKKRILPVFDNPALNRLEDSADIAGAVFLGDISPGAARSIASEAALREGGRLVMTTDGYVVKPLFFPGGDIGKLSLCGTVNDLATAGARPIALSAGFIIEEGFPFADFERILRSMKVAADGIPVHFVTGDTKVVERGRGDGIYITTTGVGVVPEGVRLSPERLTPGDAVVINGPIGSHEAAILCARDDFSLGFSPGVQVGSDCAPLHALMDKVLEAVPETRCARDPTRGGVAAVLTEIVEGTGLGIELDEDEIPVEEPVSSLCELLGLDPLLMANEGKMIVFVPGGGASRCLEAMRSVPEGKGARVIGRVHDRQARLTVKTPYGTSRIVTMPSGSQLPRIC